jgi:hypothetical protein
MKPMRDASPEQTSAAVAAVESIPRDFIYVGRRAGEGAAVFGAIVQIIDGQLSRESYYAAAQFKGSIVGGIYTGATFHEGGARGLSVASWVKRWTEASDIITWRALDDAVETALRAAKLMADSKKINEIDDILLPLRKLYASYTKQYNHASREALEQAVLRSLRSAPRKTELDRK